jgi:hypothetical protein
LKVIKGCHFGNKVLHTGPEAFPFVMQANGATTYNWTAPLGVTLLYELLVVAGEVIAEWLAHVTLAWPASVTLLHMQTCHGPSSQQAQMIHGSFTPCSWLLHVATIKPFFSV